MHHCTLPARKTDLKNILSVIFIVVLKVLFLSINSFGMFITGFYHRCNVCSDNSVLELNTTVFGLDRWNTLLPLAGRFTLALTAVAVEEDF